MKKYLINALLCLVLFAAASPKAHALVDDGWGRTHANQEMYEFWQKHGDELFQKYGLSSSFEEEFHDGLMLAFDGTNFYINENAEKIDLNQGRFDRMFAFSDGLAAVEKNGYYGYINTEGTLVIPLQFRDDGLGIGKFIGDTAIITGHYGYKYSDWLEYPPMDFRNFRGISGWEDYFWHQEPGKNPFLDTGLDYAYITRDGRMVGSIERLYEEAEIRIFMQGKLYYDTIETEKVYDKPNPVVPWVEYNGPTEGVIIKPEIPEPETPTYGQAAVKARGYTIENNIGYLLVDVTNKGKAKDQGDLFYVLYKKYKKAEGIISNTTDFLASDYILQIHYEVGANETKTIRVPVSSVSDWDLTEENLDGGWYENDMVADSRFVLAQAESETECAELVTFFKAAHDYGEMSLSYIPENGVTVLAMPYPSTQRVNYLNQKLSYFTSQF